MVTFDLGRVTTKSSSNFESIIAIVVTFDLGRVTTFLNILKCKCINCGDVRSRTSYNWLRICKRLTALIVVTFDLGRVTTGFS